MMRPLKIHFAIPEAPSFTPPVMLYPFCGIPAEHPEDPSRGRFDRYCAGALEWFQPADRVSADVAVLPWEWQNARDDRAAARATREFLRANRVAGLKTLIFSLHDSEVSVREPETLAFRSSILRSCQLPVEFALPAWIADHHFTANAQWAPRPHTVLPAVGFCGASYRRNFKIPNWFRRNFRPLRCQYERVHPRGEGLRAFALDHLVASRDVRAVIIEREHFYGGTLQNGAADWAVARRVGQEYVENMLTCEYVLCLRGRGNFSYRFYEALAAGRIPVFVNTDCVLPWEEFIPWRELCVWVEQSEIPDLGRIVAEQHRRLSPAQFADRQHHLRQIWEKHLSVEGFFRTLHGWLAARLKCES